MAAHAQNDARGTAWLLASAAQSCIADPSSAPKWQDALNNTYRLLEAYRRNVFLPLRKSRARQGARDDAEMLTLALTNERHLSEVREAIEYALAASFVSAPKEEAVKTIEEVLRAVAAPQRFQVSEEDKVKASHFFKELLRQLTDR